MTGAGTSGIEGVAGSPTPCEAAGSTGVAGPTAVSWVRSMDAPRAAASSTIAGAAGWGTTGAATGAGISMGAAGRTARGADAA